MSEAVVPIPAGFDARVGPVELAALHSAFATDAPAFWLDQAKRLDWTRFPTKAGDWSFDQADFHIRWYADGELNLSANCLDRHLAERGDRTALIFEADEPGEGRPLTYRELYEETCRFANALKSRGIGRGDRVMIYLPMIPEAAAAMLACARIGAVHCVVFGGFSPESLADRIRDCGASAVITADEGRRGGKPIPLKSNVDKALATSPVDTVIVIQRTGGDVPMTHGRDLSWSDLRLTVQPDCPPEPMNAEDPLFILYTSGSTGKPKGVVHTTGGYATWAATTFDWIFGTRDDDIFWCTADVGWITGHSYTVYGPLMNGATSVMFDGVPNYPDHGRLWETIDRLGVTILYTAPTAIRSLMREGDDWVTKYSRASLRLLGTVGEPINPEAWMWYHEVIGGKRCPIVDTWWQTETGGIMITPLPGATPTKPGTATLPFFGIVPEVVDEKGVAVPYGTSGKLVVRKPWPSMLRGLWGDNERYKQVYWTEVKGSYFTGDGCRQDKDGYFWIVGRIDDVLNVAGHRIGTAEVEGALVSHPSVAEAAVVGRPDELKGQALVCFVTLKTGQVATPELKNELRNHVGKEIGPVAKPDDIRFAEALPKTRSGKIMRRLLKQVASGMEIKGDTTTLEDLSVLAKLASSDE